MYLHYFLNLELYVNFHINPFVISIGSTCRVVLLQVKFILFQRKQPVNLFQLYSKGGLIPSRDICIFIPSWQVFLHISKISLSLLFSMLNSPSVSAWLPCQMPLVVYDPCSPQLHTHQFFQVLPILGSPALNPALQMCAFGADQRGRITFVNMLGPLCLW